MKLLILITSDPFAKSVKDGIAAGKPYVNYWTNGVLPEKEFDRVDIFNGDKLIISATARQMDILPLEESYSKYSEISGGMLDTVEDLKAMLARVFGEVPDPIGNILLTDVKFDENGLPCDYTHRSTEKFTFVNI